MSYITKKLKNAKLILLSQTGSKKISYWETRYKIGLDSGEGSYGKYAIFKADIINEFIKKKNIKAAIELGCGDGNQILLIDYPQYTGLDVSRHAITTCQGKFKDDKTKSFFLYDSRAFFNRNRILNCELALSLDVIYHLTTRDVFMKYLHDLFSLSNKYVIIYSSNHSNK
jgi:hypothetical protein